MWLALFPRRRRWGHNREVFVYSRDSPDYKAHCLKPKGQMLQAERLSLDATGRTGSLPSDSQARSNGSPVLFLEIPNKCCIQDEDGGDRPLLSPKPPLPLGLPSHISCLIQIFYSGIHKIIYLHPSALFLLFPIHINTGLTQSLSTYLPSFLSHFNNIFFICLLPPSPKFSQIHKPLVRWFLVPRSPFSHPFWLKVWTFFKAHSNVTSFMKPSVS